MKKIIDVYDYFKIENKGIVFAGINKELDYLTKHEIVDFIGIKIELRSKHGDCFLSEVKNVEVSQSLIGKKNIFVLVEDKLTNNQIKSIQFIYKSEV